MKTDQKGLSPTPHEASEMFCFQCQETAFGTGCRHTGVCGKKPDVARAQDLLIYIVKGIGLAADLAGQAGEACCKNRKMAQQFVTDALFSTITNANFDRESIEKRIDRALMLRNRLVAQCHLAGIPISRLDVLSWDGTRAEYGQKAAQVGVLCEEDEDIRSLKELTLYGLKGMSAYLEHAARLGEYDAGIHDFILHALGMLVTCRDAETLTNLVLTTGEWGVKAMDMLDKANTRAYGHPEMGEVNIGVGTRPGILVSGHDLNDLEQLLEQSKDSGVDIYTHCEMLPAHYYPRLRKYKHLRGNYGNAWWRQREELESFNGPILFTSNCIVPPTGRHTYPSRAFTTNSAGYPGWKHIPADENGHKDFSELIALARSCPPPTAIETGTIRGGFAHNQVMALADRIVAAIRNGSIRRFVVMAGCDGRMPSRDYYTQFARQLPHDCVILTAGCAKYRYIKLALGDIGGIPRVLDAGQCNDSYSLVLTALRLQEALELSDINELPVTYNIAWYEQKAVIVLLALLSLGIRNIHLGPTHPAFLSPAVARVLVERFGLEGITNAQDDLKAWGIG